MVTARPDTPKWSMVIDIDRCTGCEACVVACQAENNIPINDEDIFKQRRAMEWIRIERYWEGEFPNVKARFIPILCQHCDNAPCEPVCPVFATYHNPQGLNVQVYNRCIGTRFCSNNDPWSVRFFNYWEPSWPDTLRNQLNPDVSLRTRGVMEKCSFCIQRIHRAERSQRRETGGSNVADGSFAPACVQSCPTDALVFGDINDSESKVSKMRDDARAYRMLEEQGTEPNVIYLKKVDPSFAHGHHE